MSRSQFTPKGTLSQNRFIYSAKRSKNEKKIFFYLTSTISKLHWKTNMPQDIQSSIIINYKISQSKIDKVEWEIEKLVLKFRKIFSIFQF